MTNKTFRNSQMRAAHEVLRSVVEEKRPMVLLLGQDAWAEDDFGDPLLAGAFEKLGMSDELRSGWTSILGMDPLPPDLYDWMAERFERRVNPSSVEVLSELPWSAVFTSSIDPTLTELLSRRGRLPEPILTVSERPRASRSTTRPPLYYLFSRAGEQDPNAQPPRDRFELTARRTLHAMPLLIRMLETATSLGVIVVDGFLHGDGWLRLEDIFSTLASAPVNQVLWFGGYPELRGDDETIFDRMEQENRIVVYPMSLGTAIAEIRAMGWLADLASIDSEESNTVSFGDGSSIQVSSADRLRVEAVASIVDDSWTAFLPPLGPDSKYESFRRFHGDLGGPRLLVEGVRRGFAIEREFEHELMRYVTDALTNHARFKSAIIVEGQSGTGKSVALARVAARLREARTAPVLYSVGRVPQAEDISQFCQDAEKSQSQPMVIICDANKDIDDYDELLSGLRSRGRRVVVVGSQYRVAHHSETYEYVRVEAPPSLSEPERLGLSHILRQYLEIEELGDLTDHHFLAFLYRFLPASRPRIGSGLGAEARAAVELLDQRGKQPREVMPISQLHQQLIEKGFIDEYHPIFYEEQINKLEDDESSAGRVIDFVMLSGSLGCAMPVDLLVRAAGQGHHRIDGDLVSSLFADLDLFRWEAGDSEGNEWLVLPRLTLEAELICRRRIGSVQAEAKLLADMIGSVRQGLDNAHEIKFLLELLRQIGRDGPRGSRYKDAYGDFAHELTKLRSRFNVIDARLMLQESAFRRSAVREGAVDDDQRFELLEQAREAVQTALDEIDNGRLFAPGRTTRNLLVERAAIYGFLAYRQAQLDEPPDDIWFAYKTAQVAVHQAVSVSDNYYPYDVGLWIPADLLDSAGLPDAQRAELAADIYSTLDQVERDALPPAQREKFERRRMAVGMSLEDHRLTDDAYAELEQINSTAGYFLRARQFSPILSKDDIEITSSEDFEKARRAADFLLSHFEKVRNDERCLWLLLENLWMAEMGRRPLRGERQPLPCGDAQREILRVVRALNEAAGQSARHGTRYLEAVLTWLTGGYVEAREIFRQLDNETDHVYRGRIIKRHVVSNRDGTPTTFAGRVESQRIGSGNRRYIRVAELGQAIALLETDFRLDGVEYGRTISGFAIAFNFIGPIADPIRR